MRRLIHLLAPVGLALIIATLIPASARHLPGDPRYWLGGGLFLVLLHFVLLWEDIARLVGRRQLRYGGNTFVLAIAVLASLALVNWIASRHRVRVDLTKNQKYSLADQTKKLLLGLKEDVKITHFFVTEGDAAGDAERVRERLGEYQAISSRLKTEEVDVRRDPARARSYDIQVVPTLFVEVGTKREKANSPSEQDITNAILKATRGAQKTVCFMKGSGARDSEDSSARGLSQLRSAIEKSQYAVQGFSLLSDQGIPKACEAVVVAAPEQDLSPEAAEALRGFVAAGGKALVMAEPEFKGATPQLAGLLKGFGIEAGSDLVLDVAPQITPTGLSFVADERIIVDGQYPYHEVTKSFPLATMFHGARSMIPTANPGGAGPRASSLVETTQHGWAESDLTLKPPVRPDQGSDKMGPVAIAAAAVIAAPATSAAPAASPDTEAPKKPEGRIVAVGDVDWVSNALLRAQGNENFVLNALAWLCEDSDLISIRPREPDDDSLAIVPGSLELAVIALGSVVFLPLAFIALGVVNWWKRR